MKKIKNFIFIAVLFTGFAPLVYAQKWTPGWQYETRARNVKFVDANIGYMSHTPHSLIPLYSGVSLELTHSLLLKTIDGGANWSQQKIDSLPNLFTMDFVDQNNGFMGGQGLENGISTILKTTNGGQNWTRKRVANIRFSDMDMISSQNIVLIGQKVNGTIASNDTSIFMRSTNGGNSWISTKLNFSTNCVFFVNEGLGFMGSKNGNIYKTTNGGSSWRINTMAPYGCKKLYFENDQIGTVIFQLVPPLAVRPMAARAGICLA